MKLRRRTKESGREDLLLSFFAPLVARKRQMCSVKNHATDGFVHEKQKIISQNVENVRFCD